MMIRQSSKSIASQKKEDVLLLRDRGSSIFQSPNPSPTNEVKRIQNNSQSLQVMQINSVSLIQGKQPVQGVTIRRGQREPSLNIRQSSRHFSKVPSNPSMDQSSLHLHKQKTLNLNKNNARQMKHNTLVVKQKAIDQKTCEQKLQNLSEQLDFASQTGTYDIIMTVITIFILYYDDIRYLSVNQDQDNYFYYLVLIFFSVFIVEIIVFCIVRKDYVFSFFFWMDLISTLSTVLDIPWVLDLLQLGMISGQTSIAKAGRASRVSSRVTRLIRIIRLIRFVRIMKLYKYAKKQLDKRFKHLLVEAHSVKSFEDGGKFEPEPDSPSSQVNSIKKDYTPSQRRNTIRKITSNESNNLIFDRQFQRSSIRPMNYVPLNRLSTTGRNSIRFESPPCRFGSPNTIPFQGTLLMISEKQSDAISSQGQEEHGSIDQKSRFSKFSSIKDEPNMVGFQGDEMKQSKKIKLESASLSSESAESQEIPVMENPLAIIEEIEQPLKRQILFSSMSEHQGEGSLLNEEEEDFQIDENQKLNEEAPQETTVGKVLSHLTTRRSILLMLSIILSFPLFQDTTYWNMTTFYDTSILNLHKRYVDYGQSLQSNDFQFVLNQTLQFHFAVSIDDLVGINVFDQQVYIPPKVNWKNEDLVVFEYDDLLGNISQYIIATSYTSFIQSILNIIRTTFVIITLIIGIILFTKDSNDLVVVPIENMLSKVIRISKSPLEAAIIEENEEVYQEELKLSKNEHKIKHHLEQNTYETFILEKLIIRTGALLAIGFGEAGSRIIAENMAQGDAVNPLMPGKKISAIFGFCDIRNFTNVTEVLEEEVMIFVNEIANIVHSSVHQHHGSPNKNIGDAFLLVWKLPEQAIQFGDNEQMVVQNNVILNSHGELALYAFMRVMFNIQTSMKLQKYRKNKKILDLLPNFNVKMGYGLHIGWAIEGAIGSTFKIDASYLSPNVNMASRLESATKQYGANILMSGSFYQILSPQIQTYLRFIDKVMVKGSIFPLELFTLDVDLNKLYVKIQKEVAVVRNKKVTRYIQRRKLALNYEKLLQNKLPISQNFVDDEDLKKGRELYNQEFFSTYQQGMILYLSGNWQKAKKKFSQTLNMIEGVEDGPSKSLLDFMGEYHFESPLNWNGFRILQEK